MFATMKKITIIIIALFASYGASSQNNTATVKESVKIFKTYGFSDPDPIGRAVPIYPYYRFDGYTNKGVDKEWKVVELENDFIRLMILPEIGGKIWGAWEKSSGKPFIYYNQVVKFRDVAMRGPWTSGGIEANYGIIGHTPNCATPVDYLTETKSDGSVSCYIGTLDLLTQTYWTIEINLPVDKAYFTTRSFWHNSTPIEQPYYTWMNTGLKAAGNLEFIYPGNRYLGHSGEYADWKINAENGKNISFYEQNNFGEYKSYHVFGTYTDFFGAYWHDDNFGMGRYSLHDEKPGKKIWIWGLSPQGMIWEKLLTDKDGQYVEVQSGRLFNQAAEGSSFTPFKNLGFAPASSDSWTEYWFPVANTGGFVQANPFGALNVRVENRLLKIDFSPLQNLQDELTIRENENIVYRKKLNLQPLKVFSDSIPFDGDGSNLTVRLGDSKLEYHSARGHGLLSRPVDSPEGFDWNSLYGLYVQGKEYIRKRNYVQAEEKLQACLAKDGNYLPALTDMSMLMFQKINYERSLDYSKHALRINTYDPAANYYYGLANVQLGNLTDARDGFDIATLSVEYRAPAYLQLSRVYCAEGDLVKALHYANKSLEVNAGNTDALQMKALVLRLGKDIKNARATLTQLKNVNPLNHFIRFEEYRLENSETTRTNFTSLIRNELPHEQYLQLAEWYLNSGQLDESLEVLNLAPDNPEILYWIAFLKNKLKAPDSNEFIKKANALSPELVFPFRSSSAQVLKWVITQSDHWAPKYYLGLIHWNRNDLAKARELFSAAGNTDFAPYYASRAILFNDENFAADLTTASQLDPGQWRFGRLLANHFIENKKYPEALEEAKKLNKKFPGDFRISMLLARTLLMNKQYKASTDLLAKITVLPAEGATDGRQLYREGWLLQAIQQMETKNYKAAFNSLNMAKQWPENLGAGKPYDEDIDLRLDNYLAGVYYEKTKNSEKARQKWHEVMLYKSANNNLNTLITALALRKTNKDDEGKQLLVEWVQKEPENKLARWCLDLYNGTPAGDFPGNDNFGRIMEFLGNA
jgi:Tfp pilus assembly protein PilF